MVDDGVAFMEANAEYQRVNLRTLFPRFYNRM
jgi:hypothetical protein